MSTFQDDNDEIHQAQFMRDWPPQSPELNPTESRQDAGVDFTPPGQKKHADSNI